MGADERVSISLISICPSTGDVIYDEFDGPSVFAIVVCVGSHWATNLCLDSSMRIELEVGGLLFIAYLTWLKGMCGRQEWLILNLQSFSYLQKGWARPPRRYSRILSSAYSHLTYLVCDQKSDLCFQKPSRGCPHTNGKIQQSNVIHWRFRICISFLYGQDQVGLRRFCEL